MAMHNPFHRTLKAVRDSDASGDIDLPGTVRATERISDVLWEIGDARLLSHKDWKALIEAKGGACRLRIEELLEEQRANAD